MKNHRSARIGVLLAASAVASVSLFPGVTFADQAAVQNRSIGYVLTNRNFAIWQSADGKTECPAGYNDGPREQFAKLYPEGTPRKFAETQLEREGEIAFPGTGPEPKLVFHEPQGKTGLGLNLDSKVDADDFTSPDGEQGIDNQMYRIVGCTMNYRGPDGSARHFIESYMQGFDWNRWIIEITELDSLTDDSAVTVSIYRGLDPLTVDIAGAFTSGGTQRVDYRRGKEFMYRTTGKIEGGVLTSVPVDITYPESQSRGFPRQSVRDWRIRINLTPEGAQGLMAGYLDLERWHLNLPKQWSSHHRSYGNEPVPSQYRALRRHADAYPNEKGEKTHISTAWEVRFSQAFIIHPPQSVAGTPAAPGADGLRKASEE